MASVTVRRNKISKSLLKITHEKKKFVKLFKRQNNEITNSKCTKSKHVYLLCTCLPLGSDSWAKNPQVAHVVGVCFYLRPAPFFAPSLFRLPERDKNKRTSVLPCEESRCGRGLHHSPLGAIAEGHVRVVVLRVAVQFVGRGVHACEQRGRVQHDWAGVAATTVQARGTAAPHGRRQRRGSRAALRVHPGHFGAVNHLKQTHAPR